MKYVCSICGYVYDEAGNVPWAELPGDWKCPLCGAAKTDFAPEGAERAPAAPIRTEKTETDMKTLTAVETSALCSNLAKGCEKQYQPEQAAAFRKLADWFSSRSGEAAEPSFDAARRNGDRGAPRSLTWSEKVTRILRSLIARYLEEGDAMLDNTGVYVCTICGFVYVGNELPEVCPVCKVPQRKFERIGG